MSLAEAIHEHGFRGQVEQGLLEANDPQTQWLSNEEVKVQSSACRAEWEARAKRRMPLGK